MKDLRHQLRIVFDILRDHGYTDKEINRLLERNTNFVYSIDNDENGGVNVDESLCRNLEKLGFIIVIKVRKDLKE